MAEMVQVLAKYGYWLLFAAVLGRQACLPIPANLLLVAAGALAGMGRLNALAVVAVSVIGFLIADYGWYKAGQTWGNRALHFVSGATGERRVDKIIATFGRYGVRSLLVSKFIIGLDAVAVPMAGISRVGFTRFVIFDGLGATLWVCAYALLGYAFSHQLGQIAVYSAEIGAMVVWAGVIVVGIIVIRKLIYLSYFFYEFRLAGITPDGLKSKLAAGENILLLDLQGGGRDGRGIVGIPGAVRIDPHLLGKYMRLYQNVDLNMDREAILYCATPGARRSVRVALALRRRGFERVRPLAGGLQAWRDCGFPVTRHIENVPLPGDAASALREILLSSPSAVKKV